MLANYVDAILLANKTRPEAVQEEVARLRADLFASDEMNKLISIMGGDKDAQIDRLVNEINALKNSVRPQPPKLPPVPSVPRPSIYTAAAVIRLTRSVEALNKKVADLKKSLAEAKKYPGEVTSASVAKDASAVLRDPTSSPAAKRVAASALTQTPNKVK